MKVLLIGGGGREHALGWKLAQSPQLSSLYIDATNPGLNHIGEPCAIDSADVDAVCAFAQEKNVDLVVVGPEAPLAAGLANALRTQGVACFGPDREAAALETSKAFMKEICASAGAPTAASGVFSETAAAREFLKSQHPPYVIKADGLAAGKGVVIAQSLEEAQEAIDNMLGGKFGAASETIVIEEFLEGEEASFFAITDGETIIPLIAAQDHKRAFDGDAGPNTGGMGAYTPAPVFSAEVERRTMAAIVRPIVDEMARRGRPYIGVLYAGLMIRDGQPKLVEINARFGDPECQILMRLMKSDLLPLLKAAADRSLSGQNVEWTGEAAALVVMAAQGYPGAYETGSQISGVEAADKAPGVKIFHAGTRQKNSTLTACGGRVLNVTATGPDVRTAIARAYEGVERIHWPEGFYRRDIGWRALEASG